MISFLLHNRIAAFEKAFDYDAGYLHELVQVSPGAAIRVARLGGLIDLRKGVPADVWFAASLVASLHADCGPCAQLVVNMALAAGVSPETVRGVVSGDFDALPDAVATSARYARAVVARSVEADAYREALEARFGKAGVVSLAFALLGALIYPTLKYALGHGKACTALTVEGVRIAGPKQAVWGMEVAHGGPAL